MNTDGHKGHITGPTHLSEPVLFSGEVVHGNKRGGRLLGYPTANLALHDPLSVPFLESGVYFGRCSLAEGWGGVEGPWDMVMSIGTNPHFSADGTGKGNPWTIEVHVLCDFGGRDFYDALMHVETLGYLRPMMAFMGGIEELKQAIGRDISIARALLSKQAYRH